MAVYRGRQLENPGDPEEYLDVEWLESPPSKSSGKSDTVIVPVFKTDDTTQTIKGVDNGLSGPVRCLTYLAVCALGACGGASFIARSVDDQATVPAPEVTVTVTKPAPPSQTKADVMSPECKRALVGAQKYLEAAAKISSVNGAQLDIFSESYQAILMKDWKELNRLAVRQREIERSLATDKAKVLPQYQSLQKDIGACRSQYD